MSERVETVEEMAKRFLAELRTPFAAPVKERLVALLVRCLKIQLP